MRHNTSSKFISSAKAADILGVSRMEINRMIRAGKITGAWNAPR
jgi:hypothetical protein